MKAAALPSRFSVALGIVLLASAAQMIGAQTPDWVLQTFDSGICSWKSSSPVTLAFDPSQDHTGNGGGSCGVSFDLSQGALFNLTATFENCCACAIVIHLPLTNYASVDFDVKWDNTSTFTLDQFNSNPVASSPGISIGAMNPNAAYVTSPTICYGNVYIPNLATSGWAHVSAPINPASTNSINGGIGIYLAESFAATSGTAAFWLDNVKLVGRRSPQLIPALCHRSGNNFTLQWAANAGSTCTVLKSTDLLNWSILVTGYPTGGLTNGTASYTDTIATNSQSFYRIRTP